MSVRRWYVVEYFRGPVKMARAGPFPTKREAAEWVGGPGVESWRVDAGVYVPHDTDGKTLLYHVVREDRLEEYATLYTTWPDNTDAARAGGW